jgi:hypothetical protein
VCPLKILRKRYSIVNGEMIACELPSPLMYL